MFNAQTISRTTHYGNRYMIKCERKVWGRASAEVRSSQSPLESKEDPIARVTHPYSFVHPPLSRLTIMNPLKRPGSDNFPEAKRSFWQQPASCKFCRTKKIRCDKRRPCSSCTARGVTCEYDSSIYNLPLFQGCSG